MSSKEVVMGRSFLAVPFLALALLGGGAPGVDASTPSPADCATRGLQWPDRGDAEGATFIGRVTSRDPVDGAGRIRFHVLESTP